MLRDLKGETGWSTIGGGDTKSMAFQIRFNLEQYGTGDLPEKIGIFWAMPRATSTPEARLWEAGLFLQYS